MRLRKTRPFALTAAASALGFGPAPAPAAADAITPLGAAANPRPTCTAPDTRAFPIKTRIHGGPDAYDVGGDFGTWYLDLTNTTAHTCGNIHPIVVLVDSKRVLRPEQAQLEFYEGERAHPVEFEKSAEEENIGAFDDGFPGFTIGPGRTLTVRIRLSVTSDAAVPNDVVANAAVVQRHNDDGDWVGESNAYRFRIEDESTASDGGDGGDGGGGGGGSDGGGDGGGVDGGTSPAPDRSGTATATATATAAGDVVGKEREGEQSADELARTGQGASHGLGVAAGAVLFAAGAALLAVSRRAWFRRR